MYTVSDMIVQLESFKAAQTLSGADTLRLHRKNLGEIILPAMKIGIISSEV